MDKRFSEQKVICWDGSPRAVPSHKLVAEEPLSIRVQGKPYSVVMRTPGDEIAHVAGFCLAEGIADSPDDVGAIAFCDGSDTNVVTVTLTASRQKKIPEYAERREFVSQTSCGLCGKHVVDELFQLIRPVGERPRVDIREGLRCIEELSSHQPLRRETRSTHAAAIFAPDGALLSLAEDVGRHNALDKAVGKLFLERKLGEAGFLVLSSRISYELVQKAARARIPVIFAVSRPTALAVELASRLDMALACLAKQGGLFIFCGEDRLIT